MVDFFFEAGWFQLHMILWYRGSSWRNQHVVYVYRYTWGVWTFTFVCFPWISLERFLPGFYGSNQQKGCDPWMERLISRTIWGCLKHWTPQFSEASTVWLQGWPISSTKFIWNFLDEALNRDVCFVSGWWVSTEHATEFGIAIVAWKSPPNTMCVCPGVMGKHNMTSGQKISWQAMPKV